MVPDRPPPRPEARSNRTAAPWLRQILEGTLRGVEGLLRVSMAVAQTGLLDGYKVCTNKVELKTAHSMGLLDKNVHWVGDRRWIVGHEVWSVAGATAGIDPGAEFAKVNFEPMLVELTKTVSECKPDPDRDRLRQLKRRS